MLPITDPDTRELMGADAIPDERQPAGAYFVAFEVPGTPVAKGSMRAFRSKDRVLLVHDNAGRQRPWASAVGEAAARAWLVRYRVPVALRPLSVSITFRLPRPAGHYKPSGGLRASAPAIPAVSPDIDKLARLVLDALTGVIWADDKQVCDLDISKRYSSPTEPPGMTVTITEPVRLTGERP